jgi:tetratricopeptide (TPR) repeat protein
MRRLAVRAVEIAEQRGDPIQLALSLTRLGVSLFCPGQWGEARLHFERAVAIVQPLGAYDYAMYPFLDLGRLCLLEGAWEESVCYLDEALRGAEQLGFALAIYDIQVVLAERELMDGRIEAAHARLAALLGKGPDCVVRPQLACALLELGEPTEAGIIAAEAVAGARDGGFQENLVHALRAQALAAIRQGNRAVAERALEEGLSLTRSMPLPYMEGRLLHAYGQLHARRGEPGQAREQLEAALAIFRRLGARPDAGRVEQDIAALLQHDVSGVMDHG